MFSPYGPFGSSSPPPRYDGGSIGGSSSSSQQSAEQRLAAAGPASRQAMLSNAISSLDDWQQLLGLVQRYGRYMTANNVTHALTRLDEMLGQGQRLRPDEAAQVGLRCI